MGKRVGKQTSRKRRTYRVTPLRQWRDARGLSLEKVVDRLNDPKDEKPFITAQSLSRVERGKQPYSQPLLEGLAMAYGCDPDDLLRPPPSDVSNELESFVMKLDREKQEKALRLLKIGLDEDGKAA